MYVCIWHAFNSFHGKISGNATAFYEKLAHTLLDILSNLSVDIIMPSAVVIILKQLSKNSHSDIVSHLKEDVFTEAGRGYSQTRDL